MKDFETPETLSLELRAIGDIALTGVTIKALYAKCKSEFKCALMLLSLVMEAGIL